jgi:homopolymeric O-antigen transport system ATP-binding protein
MSNEVIICLENVGKKYCRSLKRTLIYGVRDVVKDVLGFQSYSNQLRRDEFWALNDVSFEVKRGECLGLIGANGAGKSTLVKLLNGVILPDKGMIRVHGRVGALLELGAGFHPMLTGRENIHLSGTILGLSKDEVEKKFDEIVNFADLWEFIDSPVKYYSSGMYVRLGFSVAMSIDPDILVLDESMAVGDTAFKKRCFDRIHAFINAGKTVVVVTHNLQEIERLTHRVLLLDHGMIQADGGPDESITSYMNLLNRERPRGHRECKGSGKKTAGLLIEIIRVELCGDDGGRKRYFRTHDELRVSIRFIAHRPFVNPVFRVQIYRSDGLLCHGMNTERHGINLGTISGAAELVLRYSDLSLLVGDYSVHVSVLSSQYDECPLHEFTMPNRIHFESKITDGAGVFAMPTEWITSSCE